jgi:predicted PurR-regulated permease PerM
VFKATLVVVGVILLSEIFVELMDILIMFLVALFLAAAFSPGVNRIHSWGVPRALAIIILFASVLGFIVFLAGTLIPVIARQLVDIAQSIEFWFTHLANNQNGDTFFSRTLGTMIANVLEQANPDKLLEAFNRNVEMIAGQLTDFAGKGAQIVLSTVGAIFNIVLVTLLTFFIVLDRKNLNVFFHSLFPARHQKYLTQKMDMVQNKIGQWVQGQITLFFIVGAFTYLVFSVVGIDYALTLAMLYGLAEFVPYVGPIGAFLISAPIAFNESLFTGLSLIIFHLVYQFLEGNILVPMIMRQAVGLPPVVTILALIVGASFPDVINPVMGMILAVPTATIISIFVRDFTERNTADTADIEAAAPPEKTGG